MTGQEYIIAQKAAISIHILHTKDDRSQQGRKNVRKISIHILHTKDDRVSRKVHSLPNNFNPHPSHEG